jgi:hypothetical protein
MNSNKHSTTPPTIQQKAMQVFIMNQEQTDEVTSQIILQAKVITVLHHLLPAIAVFMKIMTKRM